MSRFMTASIRASTLAPLLAALMLLMASATGLAQDPPQPPQPPPPGPEADAPADGPKQPFLGVVTSIAPPILREHLQLGDAALVVEHVVPDSPAAAADLKRFDVLRKFNNQTLLNNEQLASLVRSSKPDEPVTLTIIRNAKEQSLQVTITQRQAPGPQSPLRGPGAHRMQQIIQSFRQRLINMGNLDKPTIDRITQEFRATLEELRGPIWLNDLRPPVGPSLSYDDGVHKLSLSITNGSRSLKATDAKGNILFQGPIDTPQQRQKIPAEIQAKLQRLEAQARLEYRMRRSNPDRDHDRDNDRDHEHDRDRDRDRDRNRDDADARPDEPPGPPRSQPPFDRPEPRRSVNPL
jgi:hypothetical protein